MKRLASIHLIPDGEASINMLIRLGRERGTRYSIGEHLRRFQGTWRETLTPEEIETLGYIETMEQWESDALSEGKGWWATHLLRTQREMLTRALLECVALRIMQPGPMLIPAVVEVE